MTREILNKEVAFLLGVLESLLFTEHLSLAFSRGKGWLHIDLKAIYFFFMKIFNSIMSALLTVLRLSLAFIAYKRKEFFDSVLVFL